MSHESTNPEEPIRPADVQGRRDVERWAKTDARRALSIARAIRHPWYRCQALSEVAEAVKGRDSQQALLEEALDAAFEQAEPNRIVTVACWPLRVLVASGSAEAGPVVGRLLFVIAKEPHGLRRLDGLAAILVRVTPVAALRERVLGPFMRTAAASTGWRTERLVGWMAPWLAQHDRDAALQLLDGRGANRFTIKARAAIEALDANPAAH